MDHTKDLELVMRSRTPLVVIETTDEARMLRLLQDITMARTGDDYLPLFRWTVTDGLQWLDIRLESHRSTWRKTREMPSGTIRRRSATARRAA
ncbi:MAG: hypothetical protein U5K76_06000 [Woeseiaceae bacterium]|nr:hypothetical protein [Woeseiaceae bacterium]